MKIYLIAALLLITATVAAQSYPFAKNFVPGTIFLKDGSPKQGFIKWFPSPNEKLRFKRAEHYDADKYSFNDLAGFQTDSLQFKTLSNLTVYGESYALLNKMSNIKQTFAQVVYTGKINIYYVLYYGYDAVQGGIVTYPNIIFEKTKEDKQEYAAFPVLCACVKKNMNRPNKTCCLSFQIIPLYLKN
jgi:hypothetical protein